MSIEEIQLIYDCAELLAIVAIVGIVIFKG